MSQTDISTLKNTLQAQQQLLQRLYNELDAERESSASAANEALSVILRLQEEKAAIKMESEQYKRLAEAKTHHAEESMAILEDLIFQKEMEVSALDYQVQAYYHKLLSMGCVDPGIGELRYYENVLQTNEDKIVHVVPNFKKVMNERESNSPEMDCVDKIVEVGNGGEIYDESLDLDKKSNKSAYGSTNSYWEQIKKLDERVQEIAKLDERVQEIAGASYRNFNNEARSSFSLSLKPSAGNLCDSSNSANFGNDSKKLIDENKRPANFLQSGSAADHHCTKNIYDVFEVPQVDRNLRSHKSLTKGQKEINIAAIDCHLDVSELGTSSASQPRLNQLKRESEIIEVERAAEATNREEEMKLLNDIKEQLNLLQNEIRDSRVKKPRARDDSSLSLLSEAMIYFWL